MSADPEQMQRPGAHERHIARGALVQQVGQVFGTLVMLGVVTLLGRSLSLAEFGVYALLISIGGYLLIVQLSVEAAAVRAMSSREAENERVDAFSTALVLYAVLGAAVGLLIAAGGTVIVLAIDIPSGLEADAHVAVLVLGAVTALGWPFKVFQDLLRSQQLFGAAALAEMGGYGAMGATLTVLVVADAPLWALVLVGGSLSVWIGVSCAAVAATRGLSAFRPKAVDRDEALTMLRAAWVLFIAGATDIVVYSLDRLILAAFRGPAAVGLYEGAIRPHNALRQLQGTLVLTVLPVTSRYLAAGDDFRVRELLVRGARYVLGIVAPASVTLMVLSEPLLRVWLGDRYEGAALALVFLASYWIVGASTGAAGSMLVAAGRERDLARYAWLVAGADVVLALVLTPLFGVEGIAMAIAFPHILLFPIFFGMVRSAFPHVSVRDLARNAWLPAYGLCLPLALALAGLQLVIDIDSLLELAAVAGGCLAAYALAWLTLVATPGERVLLRSFLPG